MLHTFSVVLLAITFTTLFGCASTRTYPGDPSGNNGRIMSYSESIQKGLDELYLFADKHGIKDQLPPCSGDAIEDPSNPYSNLCRMGNPSDAKMIYRDIDTLQHDLEYSKYKCYDANDPEQAWRKNYGNLFKKCPKPPTVPKVLKQYASEDLLLLVHDWGVVLALAKSDFYAIKLAEFYIWDDCSPEDIYSPRPCSIPINKQKAYAWFLFAMEIAPGLSCDLFLVIMPGGRGDLCINPKGDIKERIVALENKMTFDEVSQGQALFKKIWNGIER